jgi:hypothetical protein
MTQRVRITLNRTQINRLLTDPNEPVGRASRRAAGRARDLARQNITTDGLVDTGRLRQSIAVEHLRSTPRETRYEVGSDLEYAIYPEVGTRDHGPRTARVLRFKPSGASGFVFAKRVRGVKAYRYLRRVLTQLKVTDWLGG